MRDPSSVLVTSRCARVASWWHEPFLTLVQYRPSGRSNRSGRSQAENDVFEGLPVKQWGRSYTRVSLAPPVLESTKAIDDRWGELPMPRDSHQLSQWTQQLLRIARSGKYGMKRKRDPENPDTLGVDEDDSESTAKLDSENRGYVIKKWKHVPDSQLEPEHKHFEFLAKRRKGLPSLYGPDAIDIASIPTRRTKVKRTNPQGLVFIYEVLIGEGQTIDGEIPATLPEEELAALPASLILGPGTVIEGLGVANDEGVVVVDQLRPLTAPRRSKSSTKKKGGPGRGKKRVTFTNPDGSTYTTVVPNATKIVPQPGQTVKHVAKGEVATADISKEEAARLAAERGGTATPGEDGEDGDDGDDDDEDDDDGDDDEDDDDREDGEVSDDEGTPAHSVVPQSAPAQPSLIDTESNKLDSETKIQASSTHALNDAVNHSTSDGVDSEITQQTQQVATEPIATNGLTSNSSHEDVLMQDTATEAVPPITEAETETEVDLPLTEHPAPVHDTALDEAAANVTSEENLVPIEETTPVAAAITNIPATEPLLPPVDNDSAPPAAPVLPTLQPTVDVAPPAAEIIGPDASAMVEDAPILPILPPVAEIAGKLGISDPATAVLPQTTAESASAVEAEIPSATEEGDEKGASGEPE